MSHRKAVIAVLMALVMVFVSIPVSRADGPDRTTWTDVQTDGGDGHPWDDGTGGQDNDPPPEDDPAVETDPQPDPEAELLLSASIGVFPSWHSSAIFYLWKVIKTEVNQTRVHRSFSKVRPVK